MQTPWGRSDSETKVAEGITFYSTPSHGGYKLSADRMAQMPPAWRVTAYSPGSWYEEDCEWAFVALRFPEVFPPEAQEHALMVCEHYYSDQYAAGLAEITL